MGNETVVKDMEAFAENTQAQEHQATNATQEHKTETPAKAHGEEKTDVFAKVFKGLGDHYDFTVFNEQICGLPVILYDQEEGLDVYANLESMQKSNKYTMEHHKIVKTTSHKPPTLDLSITNLVVFEWISMLIIFFAVIKVGSRVKKNALAAPRGLHNIFEMAYLFIKDQIVMPNIGKPQVGESLMPYFFTLFFFIFTINLVALLPGMHASTGALGVTVTLALIAFFVINITTMRQIGLGNWLKHLTGGAPWWLTPIMVPIEIISLFTKPFALTIRLFANMTAGHIVILSFVGLIFYYANMGLAPGIVLGGIAPVSVGFSVFMYALELLVAFLQAYIFTILTAVFTGLGIGSHDAHEKH